MEIKFYKNFLFNSQYRKANAQKGQAILMATIFFVGASLIILGGVARPLLQDAQDIRHLVDSKQSFLFAEGALEEVVFRHYTGLPVSIEEILVDGVYSATTSTSVELDSTNIVARGDVRQAIRKARTTLIVGTGVAFSYGLQSDVGGVHLKNTASVRGNVFSNGPITGENKNIIRGDAISADETGLIDNVHATGTAYSNTIQDSSIEGDAYYQTIINTTVDGVQYPNNQDQARSSLPISDEQIEEWKIDAESGGIYSGVCPYIINDGNVTLGPIKIPCDLKITNDAVITLGGAVWVEGDIEMKNTAVVQISNSLSGKTVPIISDDPSNPTSRGVVELENSVVFVGAGTNSYVIFISQNRSAENGGIVTAIDVQNSIDGDILVYARHGKIVLKNSVNLKEVTAYRIEVENSAEVIYESGIANLLFTSGPSGGFSITGWKEVE